LSFTSFRNPCTLLFTEMSFCSVSLLNSCTSFESSHVSVRNVSFRSFLNFAFFSSEAVHPLHLFLIA
jgi:hypothetical protein